jgi:integrase
VQLKPSTLNRYGGLLRVHVLPTWRKVPLAELTHADVASWVKGLVASGLSPSTVRQAHRVLSLVLALAVRDRRLTFNAADGVKLPRARTPDKRFLSHDEVRVLAAACGEYEALVLLLAYSGLRWGEATALRVEAVNPLQGRLTVREAVTEVNGVVVFGTPKSHATRDVPVPSFVLDAVVLHMAGKAPGDLVFTSSTGTVLRNSNFRHHVFNRAASEVGLPGLTPHELRHTAASLAVQAGANVKVVQRMLGHASAAMTLDTYAGLFGDDLDAVATRLHEAAQRASVSTLCQRASGDDSGPPL